MHRKTGIIVLNWRNAEDTVACLASLNALEERRWNIYVIDNDSQDHSVERITAWCRDHVSADRLHTVQYHWATKRVEYGAQAPEEHGRVVVLSIDANTGFA